ncbi:MAG TPA: sulfur carrier protein ThiS [Geobacteraceae bacterium]|nr:sulfur carrier protein ThiS [Geobacteraceae bacterium]
MEITVNGEKKSVSPMSVLQFLESVGIDHRRVAVEYNLDILPKDTYEKTILKEGDHLEIVHFVGGG